MYNILKLTSESIIQPHTNNHINGPLLHYIIELTIISFNYCICTSISTKYNSKNKELECWKVQILEIEFIIFKDFFFKNLTLIPQNRYSTPRG